MLAHKATKEGRLVAEVIAGKRVRFDASCIPNVAYTDPEVAWVGKTKAQLKAEGVEFKEGYFLGWQMVDLYVLIELKVKPWFYQINIPARS